MTDSFVTQCPHCQTRFRVSHAQLSVARGVVRCGSCLQVFNAARQLLEQRAHAPEAPSAEAAPRAISQKQWSAEELDLDNLDLDEELAKLERREIQHTQPQGSERRQASADRRQKDESMSASRDTAKAEEEQWAASLFSDPPDERAATIAHAEEAVEPAPVPTGKPLRTEPSMSFDLHEVDDEPTVLHTADALDPPEPTLGSEPDEPEPEPRRKRSRTTSNAHDEMLQDLEDDPLHLYTGKRPAGWGRRLFWLALVLLAAAALAGQYIAYQFDELARQDKYRPWFQELCPKLGCTVPSRVDIAHIKSSNLVVRSHPEFAGALVVDAIIYNRATFSQPFPLLELRFADLNGRMIASRRFKPAEYLSGELAGQTEMPSQTPIHIALDILDPGNKAVNYSLSFHSPE
ncbi:DUF3426 domain-containing protein [Pseudomonas proteolytica]|uniref:DUF3426 domain-containing protein n=1 Tax=Pseudomonas proteolytica TaxID=219574 RepID=A0AAW5A4R7_9PSED|nr:DUF3426 domain-containing protein [Pseudomonas proteolytica]KAA8698921.1 DUF3426 domain-containing protein [Pseudomonas proteolytica]MCF5055765.1 DUF3426 domain-containing protein [Pseudomonas proteolytica]MCF5101012.1 DUF3426 domain-containing protein [Pseudomonas proteolytica]TWR85197.1 DUF3426 domain-containing protein [Pseudomonas proteolytica]SED68739.1 MJ0042 family finger-like domain-containing protein [Pseudomonas proteolytica]